MQPVKPIIVIDLFLQERKSLFKDVALQPDAVVAMDQETCWRLFTKGMSKQQAREIATIEGDQKFGEKLLDTIAIIA